MRDYKDLLLWLTLAVIVASVAMVGYQAWQMSLYDRMLRRSDRLVAQLDTPEAERLLKGATVQPALLDSITNVCDWAGRDGQFVDYFSRDKRGAPDEVAYIYEYYLDCDSVRILLNYVWSSDPQLVSVEWEPIEVANELILFPEKQLKYRK